MKQKIFLLGVGAQKGGTAWLYQQLRKNPNVDLGFRKEYHVFDAIFSEHGSGFREDLIEEIAEKQQRNQLGLNRPDDQHLAKRLSFIDSTDNYFDYFDYLYLKNEEVEVVGDLTPSYSMLTSEAYQHIKEGLEKRGFTVKAIFLMRDPVERNLSMIRMGRRRSLKNGVVPDQSEDQAMRNTYSAPYAELRTRYDRTITELEKSFATQDIYYGFFESFFSPESFLRLQTFLNLDLKTPEFEQIINSSPKEGDITDATYYEVANHYSDVYQFVSERFNGAADKLWTGYKYLK